MKSSEISYIKTPIKGTQIEINGVLSEYSYLYEDGNTIIYDYENILTILLGKLDLHAIMAIVSGYSDANSKIDKKYYNLGYQLANQK